VLLVLVLPIGAVVRRKAAQFAANPRAVDADGNDLMVPKGWHNTFEAIIEYMYNLNEQVVGARWAGKVFPLAITIFLFVLVANWLHFLPITDSVGILHCADESHGLRGFPAEEIGHSGIYRLVVDTPLAKAEGSECPSHEAESEGESHGVEEGLNYVVTPFVRTAATDMNLPLAIAIISMVMVQVWGFQELGIGYFGKFLNLEALSRGPIGIIEFGVGLLELVSEFLKVVSFTLRLFGNIFAGSILLFVLIFLIPVGAPLAFFFFEVLVGILQAFVFAMLTMVFTSVAQAGHGSHEEEH